MNSTLTIIKRTFLAIVAVALVHSIARLAWAIWPADMSQMSTMEIMRDCAPQFDIYGFFTETTCDTDFFRYTWDPSSVVLTHLVGLLATIVIFAVAQWIIFGFDSAAPEDGPYCTNGRCPCASHHGHQVFENGQWELSPCRNPECPCREHVDHDVYSHDQGMWVVS